MANRKPLSFVKWIEQRGFHVRESWDYKKKKWVGIGKVQLDPFQKKILNRALDFDFKAGKFRYETVLYSTIKKSGKSFLAAAVAAWYAEEIGPPGTEAYVIANDLEQAEGRVMRDTKFHFQMRIERGESIYDAIKGEDVVLTDKNTKISLYRIDLPTGSYIQALAQSYKSVAGSRHGLTLWDELWGVTCTTVDTEAYTKEGWKQFADIREGELIATLNPKTQAFEWKPVKKVHVFDYDGPMIAFNHRRADMMFTPNHHVIGHFRSSGHYRLNDAPLEMRTATQAMQAYEMRLPAVNHFDGGHPDTILVPGFEYVTRKQNTYVDGKEYPSSSFTRLLGYYLSEGNITYYKYKDINVPTGFALGQRKGIHPEEYAKIQMTLDELGLEYRATDLGFSVQDKLLANYFSQFGKSYDKYVPQNIKELSSELLHEFFVAFMDGDGWKAGKGWQTELVSKRLVDDLSEIGTKLGYIVKYMGKRRRVVKHEHNAHWMYRVSFSCGNVTLDRRNNSTIENWSGTVWCPTTENGTWLARHNGTVFWTGNSELSRRTWDEMTPIPTIPHSLRFIATYAGFENESDLLWDLYLQGVGKEEHEQGKGTHIEEFGDLPVYENKRLFAYWDHEPRLPWQTDEYYEEQMGSLRPAAFLRLHMNQWVTSHEAFIPIEWYDEAAKVYEGQATIWQDHPMKYWPIYVAVDAGIKRDSTALVGVGYDGQRGKVGLAFHYIWTPTKDSQVDLDLTVEAKLRELNTKFNIVSVVYDPTHLLQTMLRLKQAGMPTREFPQNVTMMTAASQLLYDLFKNQHFEAYHDEEFRRHIQMAVAETNARGFRIVKNKVSRRHFIDAAIATAMASYEAVNSGGVDISRAVVIESPYSDATAWGPQDTAEQVIPFELQSD